MNEVTLKMLTEYLERFGWSRYQAVEEPFEKEGIIYTGWSSGPDAPSYRMTIDPMVEKACLAFRTPQIVVAPMDSTLPDRLRDLLLAIGFINYRIILGKFAYDPRDGEIRFSVDVPIDENTFTYKQFVHTMEVVIKSVEEYAPKLREIHQGALSFQAFMQGEIQREVGALLGAGGGELLSLLEALRRALEEDESDGESRRRKDAPDEI